MGCGKCADAFRQEWSCGGRAVHKELGYAVWFWDLAVPRLTSYVELTGSLSANMSLERVDSVDAAEVYDYIICG
jgi:hypothetical protein